MDIKSLEPLFHEFSPETLFTAFCLYEKYGEKLTVDDFDLEFNIKKNTVQKQLSDETICVKPVKVGRQSFFLTIEVAKMLHKHQSKVA